MANREELMSEGGEMSTETVVKESGEETFLEIFLELRVRKDEVRKISDLLARYQASFEKASSAYLQAIAALLEKEDIRVRRSDE